MISGPEAVLVGALVGLGLVVLMGGALFFLVGRRKLRAIDRRLVDIERRRRVDHLTDMVHAGEKSGQLDSDTVERLSAWLEALSDDIDTSSSDITTWSAYAPPAGKSPSEASS